MGVWPGQEQNMEDVATDIKESKGRDGGAIQTDKSYKYGSLNCQPSDENHSCDVWGLWVGGLEKKVDVKVNHLLTRSEGWIFFMVLSSDKESCTQQSTVKEV